jgi:hypothetical protein
MTVRADREREIERLRQLETKAFGRRHGKHDFYDYLEAVWKLYLKWRRENKSKGRSEQLAKFYKDKVRLRKNTHPIRAIIDASSDVDAQVKSRWTRALQYLERNAARVAKVGFRKFIEETGGIIGCAGKMASQG